MTKMSFLIILLGALTAAASFTEGVPSPCPLNQDEAEEEMPKMEGTAVVEENEEKKSQEVQVQEETYKKLEGKENSEKKTEIDLAPECTTDADATELVDGAPLVLGPLADDGSGCLIPISDMGKTTVDDKDASSKTPLSADNAQSATESVVESVDDKGKEDVVEEQADDNKEVKSDAIGVETMNSS